MQRSRRRASALPRLTVDSSDEMPFTPYTPFTPGLSPTPTPQGDRGLEALPTSTAARVVRDLQRVVAYVQPEAGGGLGVNRLSAVPESPETASELAEVHHTCLT